MTQPTLDDLLPLADRLTSALIGALEVAAVDLGDRLGWYRALADTPATAPQLAARTGTDRAVRPRVAGAAGRRRLPHRGRRPRRPGRAVLHAARGAPRDPGRRGRPDVHDAAGPHDHGLHPQHRPAGRGLPQRRRPELGTRWAPTPARARPRPTGRSSSARWSPRCSPRCPRWTPRSAPVAGSPTSAAAWAGRRSAWRPAIRRPASTGSTSTSPRWSRPGGNAAETGVADRVRFEVADAGAAGRGRAVRRRHRVRVRARPARPGRRPDGDAGDGASRRDGPRRRRAGGRDLHRAGRRRRAPDVRLQPHLLPARLAVHRGVGRHRHGDAAVDAGRLRGRRGFAGVEVLPVEHDFFRFYRLVLP